MLLSPESNSNTNNWKLSFDFSRKQRQRRKAQNQIEKPFCVRFQAPSLGHTVIFILEKVSNAFEIAKKCFFTTCYHSILGSITKYGMRQRQFIVPIHFYKHERGRRTEFCLFLAHNNLYCFGKLQNR